MRLLAGYQNIIQRSLMHPGLGIKHQYLLDINPHWTNADTADVDNKIDARFIDTSVGLYMDITVLHLDEQASSRGNKYDDVQRWSLLPVRGYLSATEG